MSLANYGSGSQWLIAGFSTEVLLKTRELNGCPWDFRAELLQSLLQERKNFEAVSVILQIHVTFVFFHNVIMLCFKFCFLHGFEDYLTHCHVPYFDRNNIKVILSNNHCNIVNNYPSIKIN